jgi:hypothetical protein
MLVIIVSWRDIYCDQMVTFGSWFLVFYFDVLIFSPLDLGFENLDLFTGDLPSQDVEANFLMLVPEIEKVECMNCAFSLIMSLWMMPWDNQLD